MSEVIGHLKTDYDTCKEPGDFMFYSAQGSEEPVGLFFRCPCGNPECFGSIGFEKSSVGPKWLWDGNKEKPTCSPSIRKLDGCKWHGYLMAGIWKSC